MFDNFYDRLNNLHRSITFTYERGGNELPFLDVKIKLADKIESEVYKKETDTDVVLNFSSIAPLKWKRSLVLWFLNRAKKLSSNNTIYKKEVVKLKEKFLRNNYPEKFFTDILRNFEENLSNNPKDKLSQSDFKHLIKVPYIGKVTFEYNTINFNLFFKSIFVQIFNLFF